MTPVELLRATLDAFARLSPPPVSLDVLWPAVLAAAFNGPSDIYADTSDRARSYVAIVVDLFHDPEHHVADGDLVFCPSEARCIHCRLAAPALPASDAITGPGAAIAAHPPGRIRDLAAASSGRPPGPAHPANRGDSSRSGNGESVRILKGAA